MRYGFKRYAGRTLTNTRRQAQRQTTNYTTKQRDERLQYRYRRMPRYKRRRWVSFTRKVRAATSRGTTRTVVFNDTISASATAAEQDWCTASLYGLRGTHTSGQNIGDSDLQAIATNEPAVTSEVSGTAYTYDGKIQFKSAVMDVTFTAGSQADNINAPIEVDLYLVRVNANNPVADNLWEAIYKPQDTVNPINIPAGNTPVNHQMRGVTLFDMSNTLALSKLKVITKRKFLLSGGESATYQIRDPRNYFFDCRRLDRDTASSAVDVRYAHPGMTQALIFCAKTPAGFTSNWKMKVGVTRKYSYTIMESNKSLSATLS